jgi:glutaminyl-tRNA synthetase
VIKDAAGTVVELRCTYDPATRGGTTADGRTVKGTIHWVSAPHSLPCTVRLYDRLFTVADPEQGDDFRSFLNPQSLVVMPDARIEPAVRSDQAGSRYQFERVGYFCSDPVESTPDALIFNRTVTLRDSWTRQNDPDKKSEGRPDRKTPGKAQTRGVTQPSTQLSDVDLIARDPALNHLYEVAVATYNEHAAIAKYIVNELPRELKDRTVQQLPFTGRELAKLVELIETNVITGSAGKDVLAIMAEHGGDPREIVEQKGLRQINDAATLQPIIDDVLDGNPDKVAAFKGGRAGLMGFFVGQVMATTGGRANPDLVRRTLEDRLNN